MVVDVYFEILSSKSSSSKIRYAKQINIFSREDKKSDQINEYPVIKSIIIVEILSSKIRYAK